MKVMNHLTNSVSKRGVEIGSSALYLIGGPVKGQRFCKGNDAIR